MLFIVVILVFLILSILFFNICSFFYNYPKRFSQTILIGLISIILFVPQMRIFYTSPNGTSFTFWKFYGKTYVIPYKYYGLFPPLFSDYIKSFTSDQSFDIIFDFYIDIKDKIILVLNSSSKSKKKLFEINNKNNSFIIMTEEEIKEYINNHPKLEYINLYNTNFGTKYERDNYMSGYQKKSNGESVQLYRLDYFSSYNHFLNFLILLFCFLFVTAIIYTIMYLRNYDVRSYSKNLYKAILIDSIEFFLTNLVVYHVLAIFIMTFFPALALLFLFVFILPIY